MKSPLLFLAVAFSSGIVLASLIKLPFFPVYCLLLILLAISLAFRNNRPSVIVLFLLTFLLGAARFIASEEKPADNIGNYIYQGKGPYIARGIIINEPLITAKQAVFLFRLEEIQSAGISHGCSGDILVRSVYTQPLYYGQEMLLCGNIYRNRFCRQDVDAMMNVKLASQVIKLGVVRGLKIKALAFWLKQGSRKLIRRYFNKLPAGIVEAMVLGDKRGIPRPLYESMIRSGTVHILVVSGFNTSIIAGIIILVLKILRIAQRPRIFIAGFMLMIYCFVAGASIPVVRATVMALVFMLAYIFQRQPDIYNSLALAAIFILVLSPQQLFDIGFQLSFISVISIAFIYPRLSALLRLEELKNRLLKWLAEGLAVSFSAWLGTLGLIAYYFKIVSPVTVFANLIIVPLSSIVTICGLSTLIAASLFPALARLFTLTTELLVLVLVSVNGWFVKLPAAYFYLPDRH